MRKLILGIFCIVTSMALALSGHAQNEEFDEFEMDPNGETRQTSNSAQSNRLADSDLSHDNDNVILGHHTITRRGRVILVPSLSNTNRVNNGSLRAVRIRPHHTRRVEKTPNATITTVEEGRMKYIKIDRNR